MKLAVTVLGLWLGAVAGAGYAAETSKPLPDPEYCARRDADPEKCVIQDGPPPRPLVRKKPPSQIPPVPVDPPSPEKPAPRPLGKS